MTYNVLMGMLNPTHSLTHSLTHSSTRSCDPSLYSPICCQSLHSVSHMCIYLCLCL